MHGCRSHLCMWRNWSFFFAYFYQKTFCDLFLSDCRVLNAVSLNLHLRWALMRFVDAWLRMSPALMEVWWYGSSNAAMWLKYNLWFLHMTGTYSNRRILYSGYKGWCYQCSSGRSCGWLYFDYPGVPNGQRCSSSSGQWRYAATLFPSTLVVTCVVMLLLLGQAWAGR